MRFPLKKIDSQRVAIDASRLRLEEAKFRFEVIRFITVGVIIALLSLAVTIYYQFIETEQASVDSDRSLISPFLDGFHAKPLLERIDTLKTILAIIQNEDDRESFQSLLFATQRELASKQAEEAAELLLFTTQSETQIVIKQVASADDEDSRNAAMRRLEELQEQERRAKESALAAAQMVQDSEEEANLVAESLGDWESRIKQEIRATQDVDEDGCFRVDEETHCLNF